MQKFMAHFIFYLSPSVVFYKNIGKVFDVVVGTLLLKDTCSISLITQCINWKILASTIEILLLLLYMYIYCIYFLLLFLHLLFIIFLFLLSLILHLLELLWNFFHYQYLTVYY